MHRTLQQHIADLRTSFFPRWDRARCWRIRQVDDLDGAEGSCDRRSKTIRLVVPPGDDLLDAVLIHEISHAAASPDHGKRWQARMEQAAQTADAMGRAGLAKLLREEIQGYQAALPVTPSEVYAEIKSAVGDSPARRFSEVLDSVRREYGLSRRDFLRRFRRARQAFDDAKQAEEEVRPIRSKGASR